MNNSREDLVESNKSSSSSSSDDEEEWRAVVAGFQMYKAAYGDLKVPQRFVVPNMPPWPRVAWGLKLGKVVTAIRATGRYVSTTPSNPPNQRSARLQLLDQLGFVWSVRRSSNDIMLDAQEDPTLRVDQIMMGVQWYRKLVLDSSSSTTGGATEIPNNFVVPDSEPWPETIRGLPLGRQLEAIMRSKNSVLRDKIATILEEDSGDSTKGADDNGDEDDYDDETLENSELPVPLTGRIEEDNTATLLTKPASDGPSDASSANDSRFKIVYTALVCYKKLYDDLLVPQPFIVPKSPQWPVDTWGLRLGSRVNAIRSQGTFVNNNDERRKLLDDLGFNWSPPKEGRRGRKPKEGSGSLFDDSSFDDEYSATESSDNAASDVIFDGSFDFGMDFDLPSTGGEKSSPMWNLDGARVPDVLSKSASAAAEQEAAAKEYEYTPERTFAESLALATERAKECGIIEGLSPKSRVIKGKREKDIPWFNDDFGDDFVFEDVVEALTVYASMYGDFSNLTNSDFVVPTPKEITGFLDDDNLEMFDSGASARAAAAIASFEEQGEIDRSQDIIAAEIMRLQREVEPSFESSSRVPVLASDIMEGAWPEHLAGMELGSLVTRIREGSLEVKHLAERKAQLDAIEFDWGDPKYFIDIPFEKAMCAMYAYYLVRGDMFVPEDFLMPDEDPWPQALSDYPLGKAVKRIRELQNFLEAYHTEKVSLLRMIDFIWFADTVALPLDPNETEMTPETLLLGAMGHPDYAKMIDIPMGLPDKIVADGPFVETDDDPKLWWRKWHNWDYVKDYWYQQGRRDNGYVLRAMGYPRMADEHEAKYGPGLLSQIDQVMIALENGSAKTMYSEEKVELLQQLNYFRQEMLGCTDIHPRDRDTLLSDLDTHIMTIIKEEKMDISIADEMETSARQQEMNNGMKNTRSVSSNSSEDDDDEGEEEEDSDSIFEEQEFDVANELGLGGEKW